jgi:predicted ThiF/HesA family dinucleotide-utilizing enzyme
MSSAILNTFAANQITSAEATQLMSRVVHTCQAGGGALDATRAIIAKVLIGGMKLIATLNEEFGAAPMMGVME